MKKQFNKLDLTLYHEKLDNGLNIYIVPKENTNNIFANFVTKYGGVDINFKLNGEVINSPYGIAHFLEHKMFEAKDNIDPFKLFEQNGAQSNAATSSYRTGYFFAGPTNFYENLETLLDFVQKPFFTDENVLKEKGIIIQELKMYKDHPDRVGYEKTLENSFVNNPIRIPVIGTIDSINSITKEDLYKCYDAFYNPSNMFLVITGNINPTKTIKFIKENQSKKKFKKNKIEKIKLEEPNKVFLKKEIKYMNITIPKVYFSYKINIKNIDIDKYLLNKYLDIYFDSLYGIVSEFNEEIEKENLTNNGVIYYFTETDDHLLVTFEAETKYPSKVIKKIKKYINENITAADFNRKKKILLSSSIYMSDNIYQINNKIVNDVLKKDKVMTDIYDINNSLKYETMKKILNQINFKNTCEVILKPNKK